MKKMINKKMVLNKMTIADLEMTGFRAGGEAPTASVVICEPPPSYNSDAKCSCIDTCDGAKTIPESMCTC